MTDQYGQMMAGTSRERLVQAVAATSDASGLISFRLGPCPLGYVWQGSVTVTNAPSGALFSSTVASTPWGQWAGPTNFGPVQLWGNETLIVSGSGLQKNTQYSMLFFGVSMPEHLATPVPPVAPLSTVSVETATLLVNGQSITGPSGVVITPPVLTRRLTLIVDPSGMTGAVTQSVIVQGQQTGAIYGIAVVTVPAGAIQVAYVAIEPAIDQTYLITNAAGTGTAKVWVLTSFTNPLIQANPASPIPVIFGATSTVTNPFPVTGNPTTSPFKSSARGNNAVANNVQVIASPGAGLSIYVQTIQIDSAFLAANTFAIGTFHPAGGGAFGVMVAANPSPLSTQMAFPGGFELPTNTALQIDVGTNGLGWTVTYIVGPSL